MFKRWRRRRRRWRTLSINSLAQVLLSFWLVCIGARARDANRWKLVVTVQISLHFVASIQHTIFSFSPSRRAHTTAKRKPWAIFNGMQTSKRQLHSIKAPSSANKLFANCHFWHARRTSNRIRALIGHRVYCFYWFATKFIAAPT